MEEKREIFTQGREYLESFLINWGKHQCDAYCLLVAFIKLLILTQALSHPYNASRYAYTLNVFHLSKEELLGKLLVNNAL